LLASASGIFSKSNGAPAIATGKLARYSSSPPPTFAFYAVTHFTLHCYRIGTWEIRRPLLTFVNAFANSILGHFYTLRNSKICFMCLAYGIAKAGELAKMKRWRLIPLQKGALESLRRDVI